MTIDLTDAHVAAVLVRAGMLPNPSRRVLAEMHAACAGVEGYSDAVLEVSRAQWATEMQGEDVLVVLMREAVVLVAMRKAGIFKAPEPTPRTVPFVDYRAVAEDDEFAGPAVFFLPLEPHEPFLLAWPSALERDRMFRAIFAAHSGRYEQWGLQLDPTNYVADFDRYYAEIVADGPTGPDGSHGWCEQQFGEFDLTNALGLASEWRRCELSDACGREPSSRVMRVANPQPWIDAGPEAERLVVRLGEQLVDAGLLGPPYDERTFDTGEPITQNDAGPARLVALMILAAHANRLHHPRAPEWIQAARRGIPAVPATVFSENLRGLWSGVESSPVM